MASEFLGRGWNHPLSENKKVRTIQPVEGEDGIRQSIWIILGTSKGERVMRPDFGSSLHDLVFAVNNSTTRGRVGTMVYDDLTRWEPRIEVLDVQVDSPPKKPNVLLIQIRYRVRSTNSVFNLVYPFYLEEQGAF